MGDNELCISGIEPMNALAFICAINTQTDMIAQSDMLSRIKVTFPEGKTRQEATMSIISLLAAFYRDGKIPHLMFGNFVKPIQHATAN